MDTQALETLIDVDELGSFAAVARERNVDPSSISRIVAQAEAELGFRLFHRSTRALSVTEEGVTYLDRVRPLVEGLNEAARSARSQTSAPSGTLRIAASVALGERRLVPLLPTFRAAYPEITLDLVLEDVQSDLVGRGIDLALRLAPELDGDLICSRIATTHYHVCCTTEWQAKLPTPDDLVNTPVLRQNLPGFRDTWQIMDDQGEVRTLPVSGPVIMSSPLALLSAARAGIGPALLADWLTEDDVRSGALVRLWPNYRAAAASFDTALWLIFPSRQFLPARTRAGIDFLKEHLSR
ncbi:MAG: LysR substrate-binding domain-containing protein [Pseudomonadota bacterium]